VGHSHAAALGNQNPLCHWHTPYQNPRRPCDRLRCPFDYPSPHSSLAIFDSLKWCCVCYPPHFWLNDSQFFWFNRHLIFEFLLWGGSLQKKLVAKVIFPTTAMQPHHHDEWVPRMLWQYFRIRNVSYGCHLHVVSTRFFVCSTYVLAAPPHLQKVMELSHSLQFSFLWLSLHFGVEYCVHGVQCWAIACQYTSIGWSELH